MPLKKKHILLTNDDNHRSPLLEFLLEYLTQTARVTAVVPSEERSWTGKGMTRFNEMFLDEIRLCGEPAYSLSGLPADCVNVGIYHLASERPDLIVSGINAGCNSTSAFVFASGTIGACFEANLAGIPAVAISQMLDSECMRTWNSSRTFPQAELERLALQTGELLPEVFNFINRHQPALSKPITWNVNLPFNFSESSEYKLTPLAFSRYGSVFKDLGGRFAHDLKYVETAEKPGSDMYELTRGHVTFSVLDLEGVCRTLGKP